MQELTLDKKQEDSLFFTSDTHFGHANIIKYCSRPFSSADEMNDALISNWSSVVGPNDTVIHLGDFCLKSKNKLRDIRNHLNGNIYLIAGNHDDLDHLPRECFQGVFESGLILLCPPSGRRVVMCHYPIASWLKVPEYAHFYGHVHSGPNSPKPYLARKGSLDVGVDNCNYAPISFDKALYLCNRYTQL